MGWEKTSTAFGKVGMLLMSWALQLMDWIAPKHPLKTTEDDLGLQSRHGRACFYAAGRVWNCGFFLTPSLPSGSDYISCFSLAFILQCVSPSLFSEYSGALPRVGLFGFFCVKYAGTGFTTHSVHEAVSVHIRSTIPILQKEAWHKVVWVCQSALVSAQK